MLSPQRSKFPQVFLGPTVNAKLVHRFDVCCTECFLCSPLKINFNLSIQIQSSNIIKISPYSENSKVQNTLITNEGHVLKTGVGWRRVLANTLLTEKTFIRRCRVRRSVGTPAILSFSLSLALSLSVWRNSPMRAMAASFLRSLDHTQWHTTVGRTPQDEGSARCRYLYLTTHDTHNRQTSMPPTEFKPAIPASERPLSP